MSCYWNDHRMGSVVGDDRRSCLSHLSSDSMRRLTITLAVLVGLVVPASAVGHGVLHPSKTSPSLSIAQARARIVRVIGPGTVATKCRQFESQLVGCDYTTPSGNVGIWFEEEWNGYKPEQDIYYGFATVSPRGVTW